MMVQFKPDSLLTVTKNSRKFIPAVFPGIDRPIAQGSSVEERGTHNPEVGGATPLPATLSPNIILGYN